jgi:hypothetical protein
MPGQLVRRDHELLQRPLVCRIDLVRIKGVDNQGAVDLDGILGLRTVKEDSTAKATHARKPLLVQHRVGPERDNSFGNSGHLILFLVPRHLHGR